MAKRQRTLLFLILFGIFLLAAPSVVLYSQGYRIDWDNKRITQTSAFFIKATPPRANISIDEKQVKRTDFLFGTILIGNVFPGQYLLEVNKEGYHSWKKVLEVQRSAVTEAKNILLFPNEIAFQQVEDRVQALWRTPGSSFALLQTTNLDGRWQLALLDLETAGKKAVLSQSHSKEDIVDIIFSQTSDRYLVQRNVADKLEYTVHGKNTDPCQGDPCPLDFLPSSVNTVAFSPVDADHILHTIFANNNQVLLAANYKTGEIFPPLANNVAAFTTRDNSVFWLDTDNALWEKDLASDLPPQRRETSPFAARGEQDLELFAFSQAILAKTEKSLFQLTPVAVSEQELFSQADSVLISPDRKKLAVSTGSELWLYYLEEEKDQPRREKGERVFLTRLSNPIENLSWLGSHYLLFTAGDTVKAMEIDTRDRLNSTDLATFPAPEVFWHEAKSTLYVLSEGVLWGSERLLR